MRNGRIVWFEREGKRTLIVELEGEELGAEFLEGVLGGGAVRAVGLGEDDYSDGSRITVVSFMDEEK